MPGASEVAARPAAPALLFLLVAGELVVMTPIVWPVASLGAGHGRARDHRLDRAA